MQCAYLNYLIKKNHVSAARLEEAAGFSAASISRIRNGQREVSSEDFSKLITAAGGDMAAYSAFCTALDAAPDVAIVDKKEDLPFSMADVRKFYADQIADIEARFIAEIQRLNEAHEKELAIMERMHDRELARLEAFYEKRSSP
jgi:transcriptional regulator with XRE-family HTH domain